MKLTKEDLRQIIVEELESFGKMHPRIREKRKRDAAMALLYASWFIIPMRNTIERLQKRVSRAERPDGWNFNALDAKIYDLLKIPSREANDAYMTVKESEDVHMSEDFEAMRDAADDDLKHFFKNRQLYDACLWIIDILESQTPSPSGMSALEAMEIVGYEPVGLDNFKEKLKEILSNDKDTQMLFDYYEAGHINPIVPF